MARQQARRGGVTVVLIGAGGHAKAICEAIEAAGGAVAAYVAPEPADWLPARHLADDDALEPSAGRVVLGIGGVEPAQLRRRLALLDGYLARGFEAMTVIHRAAHVSPAARIEAGAVVLAGAVVQPGARVGRGAIVNSQALVEHDSDIGAGTHVAPGAVVLGGCRIGSCCMIGARAVVLQNASIPDGTLVRAATRHPEKP